MLDVAEIFAGMVAGLRDTGLKDSAIARGARISPASVCRFGRGDISNPSAESYLKLAGFYQDRTGSPPTIRTGRR